MLCWDFNGKNVHILNRITENAQTKEVKEGQKKKSSSELQLLVNTQRPIIHV